MIAREGGPRGITGAIHCQIEKLFMLCVFRVSVLFLFPLSYFLYFSPVSMAMSSPISGCIFL